MKILIIERLLESWQNNERIQAGVMSINGGGVLTVVAKEAPKVGSKKLGLGNSLQKLRIASVLINFCMSKNVDFFCLWDLAQITSTGCNAKRQKSKLLIKSKTV